MVTPKSDVIQCDIPTRPQSAAVEHPLDGTSATPANVFEIQIVELAGLVAVGRFAWKGTVAG